MSTALVLSGGGAKGSFQVGALRLLYNRGVRPDILSGCSVGSINSVKLAEGEGSPSQGLAGLERIWLGLRVNEDMFLPEPWLTQVHPDLRKALEGKSEEVSLPTRGDYSAWGDLAWIFSGIEGLVIAAKVVGSLPEISRSIELLAKAGSLYNLDPIEWKLRGNPGRGIPRYLDPALVQQWAQGGKRLRLAIVGLESGGLRYVTEGGQILERDNYTQLTRPTGIHPACQPLQNRLNELIAERTSAQQELKTASGSEKSALVAEIRELNAEIGQTSADLDACQQVNPPPRRPAVADLVTAVLASAAIPALFRATTIEGETYVDGGVREVLPLQAAIDLGARTIYAIDASRPDVVPAPSFQGAQMFSILNRSLVDVAINEVAQSDHHPFRWRDRKIVGIQPAFDVHEMAQIEPGLIRIAMNYGYMRASDAVDGDALEQAQRQHWVEDAPPAGAVLQGDEPWTWVSSPKALSGSLAHTSLNRPGIHQHFFTNATPMQVRQHDVLFAHVLLDPADPPSQVMLQWNDGTWEHRAYWGQSRIPWGNEGTQGRRYMGELPPTGRWVRLDVPAALVGLEGRSVHGMAFTLFDGLAVWDAAGRRVGVVARGQDRSDRIARLRQQIRHAEQAHFGAPSPERLASLQTRKREVRSLVRERLTLGLDVPAHMEKAWMNWEWFAPAGQPDTCWPAPAPPASSTVPSQCQPIVNAINDLKAEKAGYQEEMQTASPAEKSYLSAEIRRVDGEIQARQSELESCKAQYTPPPPLDPVRHGLLLRGSGPEVYVIYGGSKLWIRSPEAFNGMGYQWSDVLQVPDGVLNRMPSHAPVDGTLLGVRNDPKVWVMDAGKRRWVRSPEVLNRDAASWDNSWPHIRQVPADTLAAIPTGPDVT